MSQGILYISYDGMLEPLGQSQVLAYLEKLAAWPADRPHQLRKVARLAGQRAAAGDPRSLRESRHRLASAALSQAPVGAGDRLGYRRRQRSAIALALRRRLSIVHARSYVAGADRPRRQACDRRELLFDMRGFWADERVDGGLWPTGGRLYRATKALERRFLLAADHVVTLTHASEEEMRHFDYRWEGCRRSP